MESIAREKSQLQPYVLATGYINNHGQLFLIVDSQVVCELEVSQVPLILISSYYYVILKDATIFFLFWKNFFLKLDKCSPSVKHLVTILHHVD